MTEQQHEDTGLEAYFETARKHTPPPSDVLMARVLDDALAAQTRSAAPAPERVGPVHDGSVFARVMAALGGWPAGASLAASALAGAWLGAYPPAALSILSAEVLTGARQSYVVDLVPGFEIGEGLTGEEGLNDV